MNCHFVCNGAQCSLLESECCNGDLRINDTNRAVEWCVQRKWSLICYDSSWDFKDAIVLCKELGLEPTGAIGGSVLVSNDNLPRVGEFNCTGLESSLSSCNYITFIPGQCLSGKVATVYCVDHGSSVHPTMSNSSTFISSFQSTLASSSSYITKDILGHSPVTLLIISSTSCCNNFSSAIVPSPTTQNQSTDNQELLLSVLVPVMILVLMLLTLTVGVGILCLLINVHNKRKVESKSKMVEPEKEENYSSIEDPIKVELQMTTSTL